MILRNDEHGHRKAGRLLPACSYAPIECCWCAVLLLTLKDWVSSTVDFYPYAGSTLSNVAVVLSAYLALRRLRSFRPMKVSSSRIEMLLRTIAVLSSVVAIVLLVLFLRGVSQIPWTDDTVLGLGLGARTISTSFLSSVEQITPVPHPDSAIGAIVTEQGLMMILALAGLIIVSAIATVRLGWMPGRRREAVLGLVGMAGIDILLGLSIHGPAFLTLDTTAGTCALAASLACVGGAVQSAEAPESTADVDTCVLRTRRRKFLRRVVMAALFLLTTCAIIHVGMCAFVVRTISKRVNRGGGAEFSAVSQPMIDATVAMEDGHFYQHHGIDWPALHRALRFDLRLGQIKQGGSTITQQLAKNVYLQDNDRTLWRKLEDIVLAAEIEQVIGKNRILELYLNTIDYGMGQHGIEEAAAFYFHKTPRRLTVPEAACLVGIVPDPFQEEVDLGRVQEGEQTALGRMTFFFPRRYSSADVDAAQAIPIDRLMYPYKDAWDRGATEEIPATWHGVSFYFYADPGTPAPVDNAAECFKKRLAGFLADAHTHLHLVGIDHLGLYNDRTTRFSNVDLSAHAFGQAMDMSGFRFANGTQIAVVDHAKNNVLAQLMPVEAMLNRHFDAVVDWRDNSLHQTHFHVEVKGPRPTASRPSVAE